MLDFAKFLKSKRGQIIMSIIWGLGLAALFRKVCAGRNCIVYKAPNPQQIINNVYQHDSKCYRYTPETTKCSNDPVAI